MISCIQSDNQNVQRRNHLFDMLNTPKGFRDFYGETAKKREFVLRKMIEVFEKYGFEPLITPALEFEETLTGKYGEEEKLIYKFETPGKDKVALRYDQTVPFARVLAQYPELPKPYKRYQVQPVWRGENTQKGRYREFLQCDIDIAGSASPLADAEIVAVVLDVMDNLGFKDAYMKINDRAVFEGVEPKYVSAIDKLEKIGDAGVVAELIAKGLSEPEAKKLLEKIKKTEMTDTLKTVFASLKALGIPESKVEFDSTLARGLNYYTGPIFELKDRAYTAGSLGGGGRYDRLLSVLGSTDIPATGFAFGFDRTLEAMEELGLFAQTQVKQKRVLVAVFNEKLVSKSLELLTLFRENSIACEIYLNEKTKVDKQFKYADQKGFNFVAIIGPDEAAQNKVNIKDLSDRSQQTLTLQEAVSQLT